MIHALLAPPLCWSCGSPASRGAPLCRACRRALRFLAPEPVALCGVPVWAPVAYEGPARALVKALKFHGATLVAQEMATLILANAPATLILANAPDPMRPGAMGAGARRADALRADALRADALRAGALHADAMRAGALVPVPLHPVRRRRRAFNQAELIARAIATRVELATCDCLRRTGPDRRQVGRGRAARLSGPAGSIHAIESAPAEVLLVDDVVTTGATLAACAAALRAAGAKRVGAVTFARTAGR